MKTSLSENVLRDVMSPLTQANQAFASKYPGETGTRQPVHTVYGGAHLFKSDSAQRLGALARRSLDQFAPDFFVFANAIGLPGGAQLLEATNGAEDVTGRLESDPEAVRRENKPAWLAHTIYQRVSEKLRREPVEDFRIDFEDGYGNRPDEEEDGHAASAAVEVADGMTAGTLPPFIGIRIKTFSEELRARSARTLDIFVSTLLEKSGGKLPQNFVVTLPKITIPEQVAALVDIFELLESKSGLAGGSLKMEMMIETTQSIINVEGRHKPSLVAGGGARPLRSRAFWDLRLHGKLQHHRCTSAHEASRLRLRQTHDAGLIRRHRHLAFRWRDKHHARCTASLYRGWTAFDAKPDRREPADRASRVEASLRSHSALIGGSFLSGLGSSSRATPDTLCRRLCFLPGKPGCRVGAFAKLCGEGGQGDAGWRRI